MKNRQVSLSLIMVAVVVHIESATIGKAKIRNFGKDSEKWILEDDIRAANQLWKPVLGIVTENDVAWLSIRIVFHSNSKPDAFVAKEIPVEWACSAMNNDSVDKWYTRADKFVAKPGLMHGWSKFMRIDTILAPNSGYLTADGSLMIQAEIRVETIVDEMGNKRVNVYDPDGAVDDSMTVTLEGWDTTYFVRTEVLTSHSAMFSECAKTEKGEKGITQRSVRLDCATDQQFFEAYLQVIHGVDGVVTKDNISGILFFAFALKSPSVVSILANCGVNIPKPSAAYDEFDILRYL